jgi:cytidylate kinase
MKKIVIAIDGYSSCGKSTMARTLAAAAGYKYIDTGAMYRAVTLYALRNELFTGDRVDTATLEKALSSISIDFSGTTLLNGEDVEEAIRSMEVAQHVSEIASLDFVRTALVSQQQLMGRDKGVVMDGRDIGTVVFPDAELKFFVTASPEVRAQRRLSELLAKGVNTSYEEVLENVRNRDYIDTHREIAPLRRAYDALEIDNSNMTIDEQNQLLLKIFEWLIRQPREEGKKYRIIELQRVKHDNYRNG